MLSPDLTNWTFSSTYAPNAHGTYQWGMSFDGNQMFFINGMFIVTSLSYPKDRTWFAATADGLTWTWIKKSNGLPPHLTPPVTGAYFISRLYPAMQEVNGALFANSAYHSGMGADYADFYAGPYAILGGEVS
jgi:hypothetical protein